MFRRPLFSITILAIVVLVSLIGYYAYTNYYLPPTVPLPPPLENVEFPSEPTPYPSDWPEDLQFPSEIVLVDSSSGILPETETQGWAAKFRYHGEPSDASQIISSFLEEKGWTIVDNNRLASGGMSLLIERDQGSGIVVVDRDPDNPLETLVIATIFP